MQRRKRLSWRYMLMGLAVLAGLLWWFLRKPETPEVPEKPAVAARPERPFHYEPIWEAPEPDLRDFPPPMAEAPMPFPMERRPFPRGFRPPPMFEPTPTPEVDNVATVDIQIIDTDDAPVRLAFVESDDCSIRRRVVGGSTHLRVDADQAACTFRARRMDGPLATWSDYEVVDLEAGENTQVTLVLPAGKTAGTGMQISRSEDGISIGRIIPGGPAEEAGLQAGDLVLEVDGIDTRELTVEEFVGLATGPEGSEVRLIVERGGSEAQEYTLTRRLLGNSPTRN